MDIELFRALPIEISSNLNIDILKENAPENEGLQIVVETAVRHIDDKNMLEMLLTMAGDTESGVFSFKIVYHGYFYSDVTSENVKLDMVGQECARQLYPYLRGVLIALTENLPISTEVAFPLSFNFFLKDQQSRKTKNKNTKRNKK